MDKVIKETTRKLTQAELLEAFPEAEQIVPSLLKELEQKRHVLVANIKERLTTIKLDSIDETYRYFWRLWLKLTLGRDLVYIDKQIARLSRQLRFIQGVPSPEGAITDDMIQAAREVPIEDLLEQSFRKSGHNLIGLCPLHDERTPSFHIYTQDNRSWCFGCNQGGDSINLTMLIHGYGFKEAVMSLAGYRR
jgi:hypothetical protein